MKTKKKSTFKGQEFIKIKVIPESVKQEKRLQHLRKNYENIK